MKTAICKLVTLPLLLMSCATDGEPEDQTEDVVEEDDPTAAALCVVPPTPPPADASWTLPPSRIQVIEDYGSGDCAAFVVNVRNVEDISAKPWGVDVSTADECVGTSITMRRYAYNTGWSFVGTETKTGVWTFQGCQLPSLGWDANTTGSVRVHVKAKQTVCAGQYCGTSYALPLKITAMQYQPPPPPN